MVEHLPNDESVGNCVSFSMAASCPRHSLRWDILLLPPQEGAEKPIQQRAQWISFALVMEILLRYIGKP